MTYILLSLSLTIFLIKNIFANYNGYKEQNSIQVYKSVNNYVDSKKNYLSKIQFLINEMKIHVEKIFYRNDVLSIDFRVVDKKNIYEIIDVLKNNFFNVISYDLKFEDNGIFVYTVQVED